MRKLQVRGSLRPALLDDADYVRLSGLPWRMMKSGRGPKYVIRDENRDGRKVRFYLHREVMQAATGTLADHRNQDVLDNRRRNLRLATAAQNQYNRGANRGATSRYKGVSWDRTESKWKVQIRTRGRQSWVGRFDSEIVAARAYDAIAKEVHGEFVRLNVP